MNSKEEEKERRGREQRLRGKEYMLGSRAKMSKVREHEEGGREGLDRS